MEELKSIHTLYTREEEREVFKNYQELKNKVMNIPNTIENQDLIKETNREIKRIQKDIYLHNVRLIKSIANKYTNNKLTFEDLFQEGSIGMLMAIDKYDLKFDCPFANYAANWVAASIFRLKQKLKGTILIPINMQQKIVKFDRIIDEYKIKYGKEPSDEEVINLLRINSLQLNEIRMSKIISNQLSIDYEIDAEGDNFQLKDIIASDEKTVENVYIEKEINQSIEYLIENAGLTRLEKEILLSRMGFNKENKPLTLETIGKSFSLTRQSIEQRQSRALKKIRKYCEKENMSIEDFRKDV